MIDISVTGLIKSFDLEKKILDGITFQIDTGERVGLLGKNGAGKTTLFRILTGELDYDAGEVSIASGRRLGLISQIPVYPEGYTVEDVLKSAFSRMQRMEDEMNALSQQMASGDESEETLRRYGELSAKFEGLGGYALGRRKDAREPRPPHFGGYGYFTSRRADEPFGPARHRMAGAVSLDVQGYGRRHLA